MPEAVTPGGRLTESEGVREEEGLRGPPWPTGHPAPVQLSRVVRPRPVATAHGDARPAGRWVGATRWAGRPPEGLQAEAPHEAAAGRAQQDTPPPRDGPAITDTPDRTVPPDPGVRV